MMVKWSASYRCGVPREEDAMPDAVRGIGSMWAADVFRTSAKRLNLRRQISKLVQQACQICNQRRQSSFGMGIIGLEHIRRGRHQLSRFGQRTEFLRGGAGSRIWHLIRRSDRSCQTGSAMTNLYKSLGSSILRPIQRHLCLAAWRPK